MSHVIGLTCLRCGREHAPSPAAYVCRTCGFGGPGHDPGILDVRYDYDAVRRDIGAAPELAHRADLFRYLPLLPLPRPGPGLPTGGTPLVPAPRLARRLGMKALYIKDETRNPTRCLKDRATAIAVAMASALGRAEVFCASAGNAAISLAGFAAHLGLACHAFVPRYASPVRLAWLRRFGASVHVSEGDYDQAVLDSEQAGSEHGWYSRNCAYNPFLVEGKKTVGLEIADQLQGRLPDLVVAPVGDGCTLSAIGKGFREAREIRLASGAPRLLGAQADAVQPVVRRFHGLGPAPDSPEATAAVSMAVRSPRNARRLLAELERSDGTMVAVSDEEIADAQRSLAMEAGMVVEFTSAATLAGLLRLADTEPLAGRVAVLVITGGRLDDEA